MIFNRFTQNYWDTMLCDGKYNWKLFDKLYCISKIYLRVELLNIIFKFFEEDATLIQVGTFD